MNDQNLFLQTAKQIDFVEFYLCYKLYDICNDRLIAGTTHSNFIGWLNLRTTDPTIILLPREKTRFSYFIKVVADHLMIKQFKNDWIDAMLKSCDVPRSHYDKHNFEVTCNKQVDRNKELIEELDKAFIAAAEFHKNQYRY